MFDEKDIEHVRDLLDANTSQLMVCGGYDSNTSEPSKHFQALSVSYLEIKSLALHHICIVALE